MEDFEGELLALAEQTDFSGVALVKHPDWGAIELARGFADRANERPNSLKTRFGVASGTKSFTALTILSLVEAGALSLATPVREIVGDDVPVIDPAVTVDHLLMHRSGAGDFLDEELFSEMDEHVLGGRSAHTFESPRDYLDLLNAHPQRTAPDQGFVYNNSGYVILSMVIELLTGSFHQAVADRVLAPAGMSHSGFFRSDDLPVDCALGYLDNGRTNVFHLPVIAAGDGGIYLSGNDVTSFWSALFANEIVSSESVALATSVMSHHTDTRAYGRGFWLDHTGEHVWLEGMDAGVSFQAGVNRASGLAYTIVSNTSTGIWPLVKLVTS